jgi:hypothetical protein
MTLNPPGCSRSDPSWKNVEMTGYVKDVTDNTDIENFAWYARGGRHTGSGAPEGCEGSSIKGDLLYNGRVRFAKEQWHVSYVFRPTTTATRDIEDRWLDSRQSCETPLRVVGDLCKWNFGWIRIWMDFKMDLGKEHII